MPTKLTPEQALKRAEQDDWDRELDELRHAERHGLIDDPGPPKCRCGWPLVPCQAESGVIPEGYDYWPRGEQEPGEPCPRSLSAQHRQRVNPLPSKQEAR